MKRILFFTFILAISMNLSYSQVFVLTDQSGVNINNDTITVVSGATAAYAAHVQNSSATVRTDSWRHQ
ncbi:MAG: hypothetical protein NTW49_12380 [Bacteroidia bacterium]|nr:hypothetical protein [Bacteroidia bacterium]